MNGVTKKMAQELFLAVLGNMILPVSLHVKINSELIWSEISKTFDNWISRWTELKPF